jgi:3'-phosphoadenosine 5'-phosphosulfate sulfotransferase (PAPS reductase)/FAD synthetase
MIPQIVNNADVIFVSHSGGKDSQAMLAKLIKLGLKDKLVLVHSDLGEMEWEPMHHWIESNSFGLPVHVVKSDMDFFEMSKKYKRLPSGRQQFCTDFLKTKPIEAFIHDYMYKHGFNTAINATGMRASESKRRAKKRPLAKSKMQRNRLHPSHKITDWLPIFDYTDSQVFLEIRDAGQRPHKMYSMGFSRLSCVFCVNGRIAEHKKAAELRPELFAKISQLEKDLGKTYRTKQVNGKKLPKYMGEYISA